MERNPFSTTFCFFFQRFAIHLISKESESPYLPKPQFNKRILLFHPFWRRDYWDRILILRDSLIKNEIELYSKKKKKLGKIREKPDARSKLVSSNSWYQWYHYRSKHFNDSLLFSASLNRHTLDNQWVLDPLNN